MPYTNVSKPTGANYTNANPIGKQVFDDVDTAYDSSTSFYDSGESGVYTGVSRPTGSVYTKINKPS
jgi:hypothetical protein